MSIRNKVGLGALALIVLIGTTLVITTIRAKTSVKEETLIENVILLADTVVALNKGVDNRENLKSLKAFDKYYDESVLKQLDEYNKSLKALSDTPYNITNHYKTQVEETEDPIGDLLAETGEDAPFGVYEDELYEDELAGDSLEEPIDQPNDPRLFEKNGDHFINLNDLDFTGGFDVVVYNNTNIQLYPYSVPHTYETLIKDKESILTLDTYLKSSSNEHATRKSKEKFVDLRYTSFSKSNTILLRVHYNNSNKVTSFEVKGGTSNEN